MIGKLTQPLKWHGGKHYLAQKIIKLMPKHTHYVEPYFGGGSVLLQKDPIGVSEVVNDVHRELTNFWKVLQHEVAFKCFKRVVEAIPFSQIEWEKSGNTKAIDPIEKAVAFFIRCRQSRAGKMQSFATLSKNRTRRGMNEQVSSWLTAIEGLPAVYERLKRVVILCDDAVKVINREDGPNTLFYLDPPYLHETRVSTSDYEFEMSEEQHFELLKTIAKCTGRVMISGYRNKAYDYWLVGWDTVDFEIDNKSSSAKKKPKMIERIWMNF